MIKINVKKLNKESSNQYVIDTGFRVYIGYKETWKRGKYNGDTTDLYVSSLGRVYDNTREKMLKLHINATGYLYCQSYYKYKTKRCTILINRLVLESFKGHSKTIKEAEADHINRITTDNNINNLQWLSRSDNLKKRVYNQKGENNNYAKYKKSDIIKIADMLQTGLYTSKEVANILNIPQSSVNNIRSKIRWKELLKDYDFSVVPIVHRNKNNTKK